MKIVDIRTCNVDAHRTNWVIVRIETEHPYTKALISAVLTSGPEARSIQLRHRYQATAEPDG